jgi:hypothetical protein
MGNHYSKNKNHRTSFCPQHAARTEWIKVVLDHSIYDCMFLFMNFALIEHPLAHCQFRQCWQLCWNSDTNNKLFKIQPVIKSFIVSRLPRRDEVLIHRLRVGHTYLTHSYLLRRETPPECDFCHVRLTIEHLLLSCCKYTAVRRKFYNVNSLQERFERV